MDIFVLGHYLLYKAHSFNRALFSENCLLHRTDNVRRHISEHISAQNGGYNLCNTTLLVGEVNEGIETDGAVEARVH